VVGSVFAVILLVNPGTQAIEEAIALDQARFVSLEVEFPSLRTTLQEKEAQGHLVREEAMWWLLPEVVHKEQYVHQIADFMFTTNQHSGRSAPMSHNRSFTPCIMRHINRSPPSVTN
jgi:hypothetical protein